MAIFNPKSLALFFGFILLIKVYFDIEFLSSTVSYGSCEETDGWTLLQWITFFSLVALVVGIILSYKKSKIGWFLLLTFSIYAFFNLIIMSLVGLEFIDESRTFDFPVLPVFHPLSAVLSSMVFYVMIYGLTRKNVLDEFQISQNFMLKIVLLNSLLFSISLLARLSF